jgi:transposase
MLDLNFTEQEQLALHYERFHHPHPRVQQKMEAVWLNSQGLPHHEIARLVCISENTLRTYLNEYLDGGIESLKEINFRRPQSELAPPRATIEAYLQQHPPATINEAVFRIEEVTGIRRSPTQVRVFLKAIGRRCLKVGVLPAKADPETQEDFKKNS